MPPSSSSSAANPTTPLLPSSDHPSQSHNERQNRVHLRSFPTSSTSVRTGVIRRAATVGRTEQQAAVRVAAAEQIEERWAYSKPMVQLDLLWNSVLVSSAIGGLIMSREETTSIPLRMWIAGYVIQCVVHMISTWMEFDNRRRQQMSSNSVDRNGDQSFNNGSGLAASSTSVGVNSSSVSLWNDHDHVQVSEDDNPSVPRYIESANTMFSFIWWIIGFYWISSGGSDLVKDAPYLYWLCVMFMTLDVFFVIICVILMFLIGVALCFCLPCIIAVMALSSDQEGATNEDIARLPKFNFKKTTTTTGEVMIKNQQEGGEIEEWCGGELTEPDEGNPAATPIVLLKDDCECVICGDSYEDGCTVIRLPCNHNYHASCIERWLHIKPLCPLCKRSIITDPYYHSCPDEAIP